jgi:hypothetical protein
MSSYEAPTITELGSVAEFTRGDSPWTRIDGWLTQDPGDHGFPYDNKIPGIKLTSR